MDHPTPPPSPQSYEGLTPDQLRELLQARDRTLAEQTAAQAAFLGAVSHDLRAPLRHVTSYGALVRELLQDALAASSALPAGGSQEDLREALGFLATMDQSARRMGQMLDGLLALDRTARAPLQLAWQPLTVAVDQVRTALEAEAPPASPFAPVVVWDVSPDLPALWADAALLGELLAQLLGNALKFSRTQTQPQIQVLPELAETGWVAFSVRDNGVGFDPARATRLGEVFQRLHREADFSGVGTGLTLCRQIATRHGGRLEIRAQPGAGCTVRVAWPEPPRAEPPRRDISAEYRARPPGSDGINAG